MPQAAPLVLHLYDKDYEIVQTYTRSFVPWKMLKSAIRLQKQFVDKSPDAYTEEDIDALTAYVVSLFDDATLTVEMLDEMTELSEMITLLQSVLSRARGIMDPTLPAPK